MNSFRLNKIQKIMVSIHLSKILLFATLIHSYYSNSLPDLPDSQMKNVSDQNNQVILTFLFFIFEMNIFNVFFIKKRRKII